MLRLPLHSSPLCRHSLDFAHVAMVYGSHLTIVPCNRDRVPIYFGDTAAVIGIALPINVAALLETLRFRHRGGSVPPRVQRWPPVNLLTASECIERERGLCRLLRKAANRGAGNCVPSRPR